MAEQPTINTAKRRSGTSWASRIMNILLLIAIVVVVVLFVKTEQQKRATEQKLQQTSQELNQIKKSTQGSGIEAAKELLTKIRTHIDIPNEPEPTVATIVDVESLQKTNDFYKKAKNGDNLVITKDRAILYDPQRNVIVDVVPVTVNESPAPTASGAPAQVPAASPATSSAPVAPSPIQ